MEQQSLIQYPPLEYTRVGLITSNAVRIMIPEIEVFGLTPPLIYPAMRNLLALMDLGTVKLKVN